MTLNPLEICRVCLKTAPDGDLIPMKDTRVDGDDVELQTIFWNFTSLSPSKTDDYPICVACIENLSTAYDFQKKCQDSDKILQALQADDAQVGEIILFKKEVPWHDENSSLSLLSDDEEEDNNYEDSRRFSESTASFKIEPVVLSAQEIDESCSSIEQTIAEGKPQKEKLMVIFKPNSERKKTSPVAKIKSNDPPVQNLCNICGLVVATSKKFSAHMKTHDPISTATGHFECKECGKSFSNRVYFRKHQIIHTPDSPVCEYCNKRFTAPSLLKIHLLTHTGVKPYECEICGKRSYSKLDRTIHMRFHTGERPYKCDYCDKSFASKSGRTSHHTVHTAKGEEYECEVCLKRFKGKHTLRQHARRHEKQMIKCEFCDKEFLCRKYLVQHMRRHQEYVPLSCDHCGKTFLDQKHLDMHSRFHMSLKENPN